MSLDDDLIDPEAHRRRESPTPSDLDDDQGPVNHFLDVHEFVEEYLVHVYARPVDRQRADFRWCPRWYEHPEALARLDALWQAFEACRVIPGAGMSTWWNGHAEPAMLALTDAEGTFRGCSPATHTPPPHLPTQPSPWR